MSIPLTDVHVAELIVHGEMAAGGSDAQTILNVYNFRRLATSIDPVKASVAAAFDTAVLQLIVPLVSQDYSWSTVGVRWIEDAEDQELLVAPVAGHVGTVATDRCKNGDCVSMLLRSAKRGRSYRGRKAIAGICEADTTADIIAAGKQAAWAAVAAALQAGFTDADGNVWVPYVVSRVLSQLKINPTALVGADVTQVVLNLNLGTQNSRKVKTKR